MKSNGENLTSSSEDVCDIDGENIILSSLNSTSEINVNSDNENSNSSEKGTWRGEKVNTCNIHCSSDFKNQTNLLIRLQLELKKLKFVTMSTAEFCHAAGQCSQVPRFLVTPSSALQWDFLPGSVKAGQSFDPGWLVELTMKGTLLGMGVAPVKKSARYVGHILCRIY